MTPAVLRDRKGAREKNEGNWAEKKETRHPVVCCVTILNSSMGARCLEVTSVAAALGRVTRLCQRC